LSQTLIVAKGSPIRSSGKICACIPEESHIHGQRCEHVRSCRHNELVKALLAITGRHVPCQDAGNIWHIAHDDPFTYKTFYDPFYDNFVYKNTERIQDTILLILHACFDICLKTLPAIFDNLYVTIALFGRFHLLNSSRFPFSS
jgi:hypothetical protein